MFDPKWIGLLIVAVGCMGCAPAQEDDAPPRALFRLVPSSHTNIEFANRLSERPTPHRTELLYEYFSNGGGVAVGDLNGDGLDDIYLTGNMSYNALYLNQGDLRFEDVTAASGTRGRRNTWKTGVTFADVNGDGRLDMYVCYSGELPLERRIDELYINQGSDASGVPQFKEQAAAFGLAHPHSSNQAYFFDYDRDGDLDLFLQTHNVTSLPRRGRTDGQGPEAPVDSINGNRFYVNVNGYFEDRTAEVGIASPPETYGLGAGISDFNQDGWLDIYVGNDYFPPDYLYINNQDGTFTNDLPERMGHISRSSMGVDAADINNDGLTDVVVADMLPEDNYRQKLLYLPNDRDILDMDVRAGAHYQYTRNTLQLNTGAGMFSEVGQLAGISNTDWSWAPLIADFDNDGWKDLFVTNGILHDITDRDFLRLRTEYMARRRYNLGPADVEQMMRHMPSTDLPNYMYRNKGGIRFDDVSAAWNIDTPFNSNGAAYSDLDNDGDLDLVLSNINDQASIHENTAADQGEAAYLKIRLEGEGANTQAVGAAVTVYTADGLHHLEQSPARGYLSSVSPVLHVGLGPHRMVDSLRITWPRGATDTLQNVAANQTLVLREADASPATGGTPESPAPAFTPRTAPMAFRHQLPDGLDDFRRQPLMVNPKSFDGPALARGDVNGDGRADVFAGGGPGQASRLYVQQPDGRFVARAQPAFAADRASDDVDALFVDVNADGALDLYVASGGYGAFGAEAAALQDRLYVNDGTGRFSRDADALPASRVSTGTVLATDVNTDGQADLFVGGRVIPGRYPTPPRNALLINDGRGHFSDQIAQRAPAAERLGLVTDAAAHDLNGDGTDELIVVGEWMAARVFRLADGQLTDVTTDYFDRLYHGLWNAVTVTDVNGDGRPDVLMGNLGTNSQLTATPDAPAELIYDDFDRNGSIEPILTISMDGQRYPYVMLDRLRRESLMLAARFRSYAHYAEATIDDLLTRSELEQANRLRADMLETALFVMTDAGRFEQRPLCPSMAAPIARCWSASARSARWSSPLKTTATSMCAAG